MDDSSSRNNKLRVQAIASDAQLVFNLQTFFQSNSRTRWLPPIERLDQWDLISHSEPNVLLLEEDLLGNISVVDAARRIKEMRPQTAIFVMVTDGSESNESVRFHRELMRATVSGVFDLSETLSFQDWIRPMRDAVTLLQRIGTQVEGQRGWVIALHGLKGGVGRSTIAANLATALASQTNDKDEPNRVLFCDFNWPFGGSNLLFDHQPLRSTLDLLPVMNTLTADFIERAASKFRPNPTLHVLSAPVENEIPGYLVDVLEEELFFPANDGVTERLLQTVEAWWENSAEPLRSDVAFHDAPVSNSTTASVPVQQLGAQDCKMLSQIIRRARAKQALTQLGRRIITSAVNYYDFVVVDLPSSVNEATLSILRLCDRIILPLTPDTLGIQSIQNWMTLPTQHRLPRHTVRLLINRTHRKSVLEPERIRELFDGQRWLPDLPEETRMETWTNMGVLAAHAPQRNKFADGINDMAAKLSRKRLRDLGIKVQAEPQASGLRTILQRA